MQGETTLVHKMSPIRRFWNRQIKIHRYFKISGGYRFMGQNLFRLLLFLIAFGAGAWLINEYVFSFSTLSDSITQHYSPAVVVLWLFVSEVIIGILPPEAFIIWAESFSQPYLMLFILAAVSYLGGFISFLIGTRINKMPKIEAWIHNKFEDWIIQIKKFGGLIIAVAALTPLPYPLVSMIAGLSGVKSGIYLRVALIRFVRFFIYAMVLWKATGA